MIIAEHLGPARTRASVGIDQRLRVDLEMPIGLGVNIPCGEDRGDCLAVAQQNPAAFQRMYPFRLGKEARDDIA
jgi:hypothetical protein